MNLVDVFDNISYIIGWILIFLMSFSLVYAWLTTIPKILKKLFSTKDKLKKRRKIIVKRKRECFTKPHTETEQKHEKKNRNIQTEYKFVESDQHKFNDDKNSIKLRRKANNKK